MQCEIIKTHDGFMVLNPTGTDYVCDAKGDNLWNTHAEAEAVIAAYPKPAKTFKVWARQVTHLYAFVEADTYEQAHDLANDLDGSTFIEQGDGDWDIYSVEEVQ